jgi:hypothetical protein
MTDWTETKTAFIRLRDDDILEARMKDRVVETLEMAKSNMEISDRLIGEGALKPMLLVIGGLLKVNPDARKFYAERGRSEKNKRASKVAIVMNSYISRVLGNLFILLNRADTPVSLFTDEDKAVAWLKIPL